MVEAIGLPLPVLAVPWSNSAHAAHHAFAEKIPSLRSLGVRVLEWPEPNTSADSGKVLVEFPGQHALAAVAELHAAAPP